VCPQIVRIEDAGPDRKARRLVFDDGTEPRLTSGAAVKALGIEVGSNTALETLETSLSEVEFPLAKERALLLLGYRERSRAELTRKLRDSGYSADIAARVVERFTEVELLDDDRFAAAWVRTRSAAGFGARRIARELAEKGIAPETASAALESISSSDAQLDLARKMLRGRTAADRKERDKLVRRLVSKGFSLQTALQATEIGETDDREEG
jgi:regulatory protein